MFALSSTLLAFSSRDDAAPLQSINTDDSSCNLVINDFDPSVKILYDDPEKFYEVSLSFSSAIKELTKACGSGDLVESALITEDKVFVSRLDTLHDIYIFKIVIPK